MIDFFKKSNDTRKLSSTSESRNTEVLKKVYDLGFEVGYNKHSELGWVTDKYSRLYSLSKMYGLDEYVHRYYIRGKREGAQEKEQNLYASLSREEKKNKDEEKELQESQELNSETNFESGFGCTYSNDYECIQSPAQKPTMMDLPDFLAKPKKLEKPDSVKGFKPFTHRR
ncbi:hypothetical protein [Methanohalobium sp.]|uniref:hypothetical protein n=1 Tax=Methanohalobium sp. TaxID=2837493 RepID=UPI0025D350F7|nr:hypothetical protein [Methanohalobium sp.]